LASILPDIYIYITSHGRWRWSKPQRRRGIAAAAGGAALQGRALPEMGPVGVGDPDAQQPREDLVGLLLVSGEGGAGVRRRRRLPPRLPGRVAQLPRVPAQRPAHPWRDADA